MSRPGFVLDVDEKTPPLLTMAGQAFRLQRFGTGTRVVYPADPAPSSDPITLIDAALESPVGADPLPAALARATRLTIVVSDNSRPQPAMRFDVRRNIVERVLEHAARAGVDDVQIVIASGLNRRWSATDVKAILGDRVATSFLPGGLVSSHDVTADDLALVGEVDGHEVRLNARVAESDLVVSVGTADDLRTGCPFALGLTDAATINWLDGVHRDAQAAHRVADLVWERIPTYSVTAVLGQPLLGPALSFMNKREWEWRLPDQLAYAGARQLGAAFPRLAAQRFNAKVVADYVISDLIGGNPAQVAREAAEAWRAANIVDVGPAADVLVASVWGSAFDAGNPVGSPINAAHNALVMQAGSHTGTPIVRPGGAVVAFHPLADNFSHRTQSAASDFFATVLTETLDPDVIAERFEPSAMSDPWYLNLYREHSAHHPLRVFHTWYRVAEAARQVGDVIWVGGDRRSAAVLGHRAASTFADALELAAGVVGSQPRILHLHGPGRALGSVS